MENYKKILVILAFIQLVHLLDYAATITKETSDAKNKLIVSNITRLQNYNQ